VKEKAGWLSLLASIADGLLSLWLNFLNIQIHLR